MLKVSILSPDKKIFEGNANLVEVPGEKGRFQMLVNHAPIVSSLVKGFIRIIENNNSETKFEIESGVVECANNEIIILIEK
ncbi:MAG TPA: ATP synthase F1 subunit epsilon [Bacteroidales bacterium]|nr:ATP synthase F1 subunit epsilon [Bacteroidales bacterium]HXK81612.1 ATP synthase F1 subunit epsilon [Bacteroidales bacterium]